MRRLIQELPYERPLAAGRYIYAENGEKTGAEETWQLSSAQEGYRFLRVDINAGETRADHVLYHLVLNTSGRPERLKFRLFRPGQQVIGDLLFEGETVVLSRAVNAERVASEAPFAGETAFWFPSAAGLSLLAGATSGSGLTLNRAQNLGLCATRLDLREGPPETIEVMGRQIEARPASARWDDKECMIWFDAHQWPVRVQCGAWTASDKRYIRY